MTSKQKFSCAQTWAFLARVFDNRIGFLLFRILSRATRSATVWSSGVAQAPSGRPDARLFVFKLRPIKVSPRVRTCIISGGL